MDKAIINELATIWNGISAEKRPGNKYQQADITQKLMAFLQVGQFYYFIFNFDTVDIELVSDGFREMLGYEKEKCNAQFLLGLIHPEDQHYFFRYENESIKFFLSLPQEKRLRYKLSMDYRVQRKDGAYLRISHQVIILEQYDDGTFFRTLGVHTDITHIKPAGAPTLSFIGMEGEPSYYNVIPGSPFIRTEEPLSPREKEILLLLVEGKSSQEIANLHNISTHTVETHRRNMLGKTKCKTTAQLTAMAVRNGWL